MESHFLYEKLGEIHVCHFDPFSFSLHSLTHSLILSLSCSLIFLLTANHFKVLQQYSQGCEGGAHVLQGGFLWRLPTISQSMCDVYVCECCGIWCPCSTSPSLPLCLSISRIECLSSVATSLRSCLISMPVCLSHIPRQRCALCVCAYVYVCVSLWAPDVYTSVYVCVLFTIAIATENTRATRT